MTKKDLLEAIEDMPKVIYDRCLYIKWGTNGLWYCGYDNTALHASDKDLLVALDLLYIILKTQGLC